MSDPELIEAVARYYGGKLAEHGPTPAGVDWNGVASQRLRFDQLLAVIRRRLGNGLDRDRVVTR